MSYNIKTVLELTVTDENGDIVLFIIIPNEGNIFSIFGTDSSQMKGIYGFHCLVSDLNSDNGTFGQWDIRTDDGNF